MTGLIWEVQRVHYPMFMALRSLPLTEFQQWMNFHTTHVSSIVGPVMLFEAATGALLVLNPPKDIPQGLILTNLLLVASSGALGPQPTTSIENVCTIV